MNTPKHPNLLRTTRLAYGHVSRIRSPICYAVGVQSAKSPQVARTGSRIARVIAWAALALALVAGATQLGWQRERLVEAWPIIAQFANPEAQHRLMGSVSHYPHDLLAQADASLPITATVLLVTPGTRTTDYEYTTYHRALYLLAPRPVWWIAPSPPDGTWKARWWISAPAAAESVRAVAREKGAAYVLAAGLDLPPNGGRVVFSTPEGSLIRLDGSEADVSGARGPQYVGPLGLLALVLGLAVAFVLGAGLVWLAGDLGYRARGAEAWALAWALGAGLLTVLMPLLLVAGAGWPGTVAILGVLAIGVTVYLVVQRAQAIELDEYEVQLPPARLNPLEVVLLVVIAAQTGYVALMSMGRPLIVWDSWVNWATKARAIFYDGAIGPAVYSDPSRAVTNLDYPLLMPLLESWLFRWAGAPDDRLVGVAQMLFFLSLVALTFAAARGAGAGRSLALLAAAVVATMLLMSALAADGFAEAALSVYALASAAYLLTWLRGGPPGALAIAAVSGGLMAWTKREGIVLLAVLCLAVLIVGTARRRAWVGVGMLALGGVVIAGPWYAVVALFGIPNAAFAPVSMDAFMPNAGRVRLIGKYVRDVLLHARLGWLWPLALGAGLAALAAGVGRRLDRWSVLVPLLAVAYGAAASLFYVFSAYEPLEMHLLTSVERLFAPHLPLLAVWIASLGSRSETPLAFGGEAGYNKESGAGRASTSGPGFTA
jgi:hypothetical protein